MGRRRTATVRAKSFANLFILRKADLDKTLIDYPDSREKFRLKAEQMLRHDECKGKDRADEHETGEGLAHVQHADFQVVPKVSVALMGGSREHTLDRLSQDHEVHKISQPGNTLSNTTAQQNARQHTRHTIA